MKATSACQFQTIAVTFISTSNDSGIDILILCLFSQESELQLRRHGSCAVLVDLELPHLVRLEEDPLRTEIMLYRIMVKQPF